MQCLTYARRRYVGYDFMGYDFMLSDSVRSEYWGSRLIWNSGAYLPEYMTLYPSERNCPNSILQCYSFSDTEKIFCHRISVDLPLTKFLFLMKALS
jgi:hypothetical protein